MTMRFICLAVVLASCVPPAPEPLDGGVSSPDSGAPDAGTLDGGHEADAGASCDATCTGCCLDGRCLQFAEQNEYLCGTNANRCRACSLAELCDPRGCVPRRNPDGGFLGAVGSACLVDTDCGSDNMGLCFAEFHIDQYSGWPGGYCSRTCRDTTCPAGSECMPGTVPYCIASCDAGVDCRTGYDCSTTKLCLPQ